MTPRAKTPPRGVFGFVPRSRLLHRRRGLSLPPRFAQFLHRETLRTLRNESATHLSGAFSLRCRPPRHFDVLPIRHQRLGGLAPRFRQFLHRETLRTLRNERATQMSGFFLSSLPPASPLRRTIYTPSAPRRSCALSDAISASRDPSWERRVILRCRPPRLHKLRDSSLSVAPSCPSENMVALRRSIAPS